MANEEDKDVHLPAVSDDWRDFLRDDARCCRLNPGQFTNSLAVDIFNRCPYSLVTNVLKKMAPTDDYFSDMTDKSISSSARGLAVKKKKFKRKKMATNFLGEQFLPKKKEPPNPLTPRKRRMQETIDKKTDDIKSLKKKLVKSETVNEQTLKKSLDLEANNEVLLRDHESQIYALNQLTESLNSASTEKASLTKQVQDAEELYEKQSEKLQLTLKKLSDPDKIRNLNRKLARRDLSISEMNLEITGLSGKCLQNSDQISKLETSLQEVSAELIDANKKCKQLSVDKIALQKKVGYLKNRNTLRLQKIIEQNSEDIVKYEERILVLKEENEYLSDMEGLFAKEITTFENGRYTNPIRELVMDLLSENVGVRHISSVIRKVLKKLVNVDCSRLPSAALINTIQAESKFVSKIQVARALLESEYSTLHSDGTSKQFKHYQGFQVTAGSQGSLTMGLDEVTGGDTDTVMEAFHTEIKDLARYISSDEEERRQKEAEMLVCIKNTMSDRHIVNKCFNDKLYELRAKALPTAIPNFMNLGEDERKQLLRMNHRFCGMHLVVNLATAADDSLRVWEKMVGDGRQLGSAGVGGMWPSQSESGVQRLIRTSCKALETHGSEQSGQAGPFNTYLLGRERKNTMVSFRGNRFNVIFRNGGAVYYHRHDIENFLTKVWGTPNKLLVAVLADVIEPSLIAGARALGIVSKVITTPLWKVLESDLHIEDMPEKYLQLISKCEEWAEDASKLLFEGDCVFPDVQINKDEVYDELFNADNSNAEVDVLTLEALQIVLAAFIVLMNRQVGDILPGVNKSDEVGAKCCEAIRSETKTMPKTNTISERDFGVLDLLKRTKPNMSTLGLEASVMFSNNKTSQFLASLDPIAKDKLLDDARGQGPKIIKTYKERKKLTQEKRLLALKAKEEEKRKKGDKEREDKTKVTNAVAVSGGVWSVDEIDRRLSSTDHKQLTEQLKSQLRMRKILGFNLKGPKDLFQYSKGGVKFTNQQLAENLKLVIVSSADATPSASVDESEEEKRRILEERRVKLALELERLGSCAETELVKVKKVAEKRDNKRIGIERAVFRDFGELPELVGRRVEQLYFDKVEKSETWWEGRVLRCNNEDCEDALKKMFVIVYSGDEAEYVLNLYSDYFNGELNVLD